MVCNTSRMSLVEAPNIYAFASFFIAVCFVSTIGNTIALIVLSKFTQRTRSNWILTSLALSDGLLGSIVAPITAYELINSTTITGCTLDNTRSYLAPFIGGVSVLTLAVIAVDRYLLMTKRKVDQQKRSRYMIVALMLMAWIVPALTPLLRNVNLITFIVLSMAIFICPFFIIIFCYVQITRLLKESENRLRRGQQQSSTFQNAESSVVEDQSSYNPSATSTVRKSVEHHPDSSGQQGKTTKTFSKRNTITRRGHIRVAKAVVCLLLAYFCCMTPLNLWLIFDLMNAYLRFMPTHPHHHLYVVAMLTALINPCVNPIIYFWKNPDIRKGFKKLTNLRRRAIRCTENKSAIK